jgi:hypothetical protein
MVTSVTNCITLQFVVAVDSGGTVFGVIVRVSRFGRGVNVGVAVPCPSGVLVGRSACMVCAADVRLAPSGVGVLDGRLQAPRNIVKIINNDIKSVLFLMFLLL